MGANVVIIKREILILDANVLIDYIRCDPMIIKLIRQFIGSIYLPTPILDEVKELQENDCTELGIILVEPELSQLIEAGRKKGPLSFQDRLCLILAQKHGWTCVTNDMALRRECEKKDIKLIWGIELICLLVESGGLPVSHAQEFICKIHQANPKYITEKIVKRAFRRLGTDSYIG
jgi:predicted nucleic acid-binding protein